MEALIPSCMREPKLVCNNDSPRLPVYIIIILLFKKLPYLYFERMTFTKILKNEKRTIFVHKQLINIFFKI